MGEVVLDYFKVKELKKGLERAIVRYRKAWMAFMVEAEHGFTGLAQRDISLELLQVEIQVSQARKPRITRELDDVGLDSPEIASEDNVILEAYQSTGLQFPYLWRKRLKRIGELIDLQLWRIKLLFLDGIKLVDNLNPSDALEIFKQEGEVLERFSLHDEEDSHVEHSPPAIAARDGLEGLLHEHHTVMAKMRMLHFCERIGMRLSTRNTGYNVLLA